MDVERTQRRRFQRPRRQEQTVGCNHQHLRANGAEARECIVVLQGRRLKQFETAFERKFLDVTGAGAQAPAGGAVGLGQYQRYVVAGSYQRRQRARRKLGSACED